MSLVLHSLLLLLRSAVPSGLPIALSSVFLDYFSGLIPSPRHSALVDGLPAAICAAHQDVLPLGLCIALSTHARHFSHSMNGLEQVHWGHVQWGYCDIGMSSSYNDAQFMRPMSLMTSRISCCAFGG